MNCEILPLAAFVESAYLALYVRNKLTRPGSDFQRKIDALLFGEREAFDRDGEIALVFDHGQVIGWARTEYWSAGDEVLYDTLEAFVAEDYRLRGIAAFASAGLYAKALFDNGGTVAVFHPHMLLVAKRAGFFATLFAKVDGKWVRA